MILPIDWLKEFVDVTESPEELAEILLMLGFPADTITPDYLDLEVTPNRGDVLNIYGIAREYAAYKNIEFKPYAATLNTHKGQSGMVSFTPQAKKAIWRYSYLVARGGKVGESESKIKARLKTIGLNAKNSIIDITNYLMHECGQPIHAYDLDKIKELKIDFAQEGERAKLLNGAEATLSSKNLVAYDGQHIVDLVGISGGAMPAIDRDTTNILVQAAIFEPAIIRRSSKASNVATPASYRYERGVDYDLPPIALAHIAQYLTKWGFTIESIVDVTPNLPEPCSIKLDTNTLAKLSGTSIEEIQVSTILPRLGFVAKGDDSFTVPSWRYGDVKETVDLAEEVIRLAGFNNIKPEPLPAQEKQSQDSFNMSLRTKLCDLGLTETYNYSFLSAKEIEAAGIKPPALTEVTNPLSENYRYMRPSLIPKLIQAASINPWFNDFTIFEIGHVFHAPENETNYLGVVSTNSNGQIAKIFSQDQITKITIDSDLGKLFKLRRPVFVAEAPVSDIKLIVHDSQPTLSRTAFKNISKYPPVIEDVSLVVDRNTDALVVAQTLTLSDTDHILLAEPFDEFASDKLGTDKKSIALRIVYQNTKETLTADQARQLHRRTVEFLKQKYNAKLRGE